MELDTTGIRIGDVFALPLGRQFIVSELLKGGDIYVKVMERVDNKWDFLFKAYIKNKVENDNR